MCFVEEIRNISSPDIKSTEAVEQIWSVPRPGPSSDRRDCRSWGGKGDDGDSRSTGTRTGWKSGRGNVRRHRLRVRGIRRVEDKYESREESPQEGLPHGIRMARPR